MQEPLAVPAPPSRPDQRPGWNPDQAGRLARLPDGRLVDVVTLSGDGRRAHVQRASGVGPLEVVAVRDLQPVPRLGLHLERGCRVILPSGRRGTLDGIARGIAHGPRDEGSGFSISAHLVERID